MRQVLIAAVGWILLLSTACSASVGTDPRAISADKLERQVSDALAEQVGQTPDDVSCPKNLEAEKGATVRCTLTAGSDMLGVTVTTKSVDDDGQVNFAIAVDDQMSN